MTQNPQTMTPESFPVQFAALTRARRGFANADSDFSAYMAAGFLRAASLCFADLETAEAELTRAERALERAANASAALASERAARAALTQTPAASALASALFTSARWAAKASALVLILTPSAV